MNKTQQLKQSEAKPNNKERLVKTTFYITYVFLLTTATITFIEAMRTKDSKIRNILNLETCISVVAAYFYGLFVKEIEGKTLNYEQINVTRYTDWAITTPIMLLVLVLAFLYNTGGRLSFWTFCIILALNYAMLGFGYLGETGVIGKLQGIVLGFGAFAALYGFIYKTFLHKKYKFDNSILYWAFLILWSGYGALYLADHEIRNVGNNILDLFAKCFVGIFFWAYFTKTFTL